MPIKPGIYQHYKGGLYRVHHEVCHSETREKLVLYEALYDTKIDTQFFVRPADMFAETVVVNNKSVSRFAWVGEYEGIKRPKVGLGVIISKDGKVLLGKRKNAHGHGTWGFPGGHLEFGETFAECAYRETLEEAGIQISEPQFVTATNDIILDEDKHYVTIYLKAEYLGGELKNLEPHKLEGWQWFAWEQLPEPLFLPIKNLRASGFSL